MPLLGRDAQILKNGTEIGDDQNVTISIDAALLKQYKFGSANPSFLASGNKTYSISIEKAYIDNTYANDVLNGSEVTIEVRPEGDGTGKPKWTLSGVIFNSWELGIAQEGIELESLSGEGKELTYGTLA